jgi:hypothetical protein
LCPKTYNIRTRKHDNEELNSSLSWPWGLVTFKQKKHDDELNSLSLCFFFCSSVVSPKGTLEQKNMMMKSWALRCSSHGDPHHLNKKNTMTRNRTSRHCVPRTCNIKTKKNMTTRSRTPHHCAFE